ncbi:MAG: hypothetical protein J6B01_13660 [Ruminococcus sp.]|nr:hypothetical protein [Ruminococcus sp.]MBP3379389.1 hypothetical protein [Ruminococcus sp.]
MKKPNSTFTVTKDIIAKHSNSDISPYIRDAINYYFDLKLERHKLIFAPELELFIKPSKHCQISVRLSDKGIKKIKRISKRYHTTLSDTIDNMLKLYEIAKEYGFSNEAVIKMNKRVRINPSPIERIKITEDILLDKPFSVKVRSPKGNGIQAIKGKDLYRSIEYALDSIYLSAEELKSMLDAFDTEYNYPYGNTIETRITTQQMNKLNRLKVQIAAILSKKENLSDVLRYCVVYYKKNHFSEKPKCKPVAFTVLGSKTDKCFDTMFENALSICDDKIVVIEVCGGCCGVLPMYYNRNVKAYILNELDSKRRDLIAKIKSDPYDLINGCQQIHVLVSSSIYMDFTSKKSTIDAIETFLKLNHCMEEAITLFRHCTNSQSKLSISEYLQKFQERYNNTTALHNYIYNAVITGYNLLDLIEYYKDNTNVLFIIDPPYYLTNDCYKSNCPDMHFHKELAELLRKIKGRFILCLRINASRANNSKDNELIDRVLYEFYNMAYGSGKFYMYCDDFDNDKLMINFKNVGTLEAVISNYQFDGCEPIAAVLGKYRNKNFSQLFPNAKSISS